MLDIVTAIVDRCVITQAITEIIIKTIFKMDLGWEKDIWREIFGHFGLNQGQQYNLLISEKINDISSQIIRHPFS